MGVSNDSATSISKWTYSPMIDLIRPRGLRTRRKESSETRMPLRLMAYCPKAVARWLHG